MTANYHICECVCKIDSRNEKSNYCHSKHVKILDSLQLLFHVCMLTIRVLHKMIFCHFRSRASLLSWSYCKYYKSKICPALKPGFLLGFSCQCFVLKLVNRIYLAHADAGYAAWMMIIIKRQQLFFIMSFIYKD